MCLIVDMCNFIPLLCITLREKVIKFSVLNTFSRNSIDIWSMSSWIISFWHNSRGSYIIAVAINYRGDWLFFLLLVPPPVLLNTVDQRLVCSPPDFISLQIWNCIWWKVFLQLFYTLLDLFIPLWCLLHTFLLRLFWSWQIIITIIFRTCFLLNQSPSHHRFFRDFFDPGESSLSLIFLNQIEHAFYSIEVHHTTDVHYFEA